MNRLRCPESDSLGAAARNPGRRPAFLITGVLGLAWVLVGKIFYYPPESHPNIGEAERTMILAAKSQECHAAESSGPGGALANWGSLLARRHTWGIILGRALTDPVWFFVTDWFAIFLVARGFRFENTLAGFWIPFLAANFGNFFGGGYRAAPGFLELHRLGRHVLISS